MRFFQKLSAFLLLTTSLFGATSYANLGGTGDRRRMVKLSHSGMYAGNNLGAFFDGNTTAHVNWLAGGTVDSSRSMTVDFGTDQYIVDEVKFYQTATDAQGTWKWRGSNDCSSWTDIGSSFTLGGATIQTITALSGNTTAYSCLQLIGVSGSSTSSPDTIEWEFKIDSAGNRTNGTAYTNTLSTGDRTASITVTTSGNFGGTASTEVNGLYGTSASYLNGVTTTGDYMRWDLGTAKLVDEIAFWFSGSGSYGTWKLQGSSDASSWTDLGSSFTLQNYAYSPVIADAWGALHGNTTAYRYFQLYCVTGASFPGDGNVEEVEFRIGDVAAAGSVKHRVVSR